MKKDVNVEVIINVKDDTDDEKEESSEEIKSFLDAIDEIQKINNKFEIKD